MGPTRSTRLPAALDEWLEAPPILHRQKSARAILLELFHGPTLAFKDVAMQLVSRLMDHVLARRNEGVVQMILTSGNVAHDLAHIEDLATISGRPLLDNVVQVYEERPHIHRNQLAWLDRCRQRGMPVYGQGVTTDAGVTFTSEDWNLYDDSEAWGEATTGTFCSSRRRRRLEPW